MQFGSEEMKEMLIQAYTQPDKYQQIMEEVYESVKAHTLERLTSGFKEDELEYGSKPITTSNIQYYEYDDIVNEVFCRVVCSLEAFILNELRKGHTEAQRQAWLRRIIYVTFADYYKKKRRCVPTVSFVDITDEYGNELYNTDDPFYEDMYEKKMKNFVRIACLAPSKPEKILTYFFNSIIFLELTGHKKNGAAKLTCNYMNGKSLYELKQSMLMWFEYKFNIHITSAEISPLEIALGGDIPTKKGMEICDITPQTVSDWSNRIKTYVFKHKNEFFDEEGEIKC